MRLEWTRAIAILSVTVLVSALQRTTPAGDRRRQCRAGKARSSQATRYAGGAMREAEQSKAALDSELKAQEQKWVKSYDRARELASAPPPPRSAPPPRPARRARRRAQGGAAAKAAAADARPRGPPPSAPART